MSKLLTRKEAAERLGISLETLDQLRRSRKIDYVQMKPNGRVWISEEAIEVFIARSTHQARPANEVVDTYRKRRILA